MSVCIFLFCTLQTVVEAVNFGLHSGNASRLVTRHYVSLVFNLPLNSTSSKSPPFPVCRRRPSPIWFGGIYRGSEKLLRQLRTEPAPFLEIYPEFMLPPDQKENGCTIGAAPSSGANWRNTSAGRWAIPFELESFIPPYRVGHPFEFVIDGIYDTDRGEVSRHRSELDVLQLQVSL